MYSIKNVQECLAGLIAFQQTQHQDYPELAEALTKGSSGLTYQDFHPLIQIENIVAVAPRFDEYTEADKPKVISDFLKQTVNASSQKLVNAVFLKKKLERNTKTILNDVQLYHGAGAYTNKIIKTGRFVGFELNLRTSADLAVIISELGTQFDTKNPDFKLYIFDAQKSEPVKEFTLNLANEVLFGWSKLETTVDNQVVKTSLQGGPYYIGYYEDDLIGQALKRTDDLSRRPCAGCSNDNNTAYNQWSPHIGLRPFFVASSDYDKGLMWEPGLITYVNNTNWGLNFRLSVQCDLSNFLCRHREVFTQALGLQVAVDLIEKMLFSCRDNDLKEKLQPMAAGALDNSTAGMPGLKEQLSKAIDALEFDLSGFDSRCLPCQNQPKVRHRGW